MRELVMSSEKFKLLTGALALRQFTVGELSEAACVRPNTAKSWLQRNHSNGRYVTPTGLKRKPASGRPAQIWSLKQGADEFIRAELHELNIPLNIGTPEEAASAFADDDIRVLVRRHLLLAGRQRNPEMRCEELAEAQDWLQHEASRLRDWELRGFTCPRSVLDEIDVLKDWLHGLELCADRIGFEECGDNILSMADWFTRSIELWFEGPETAKRNAFSPLELAHHGDFTLRQALVRQLLVVFRTAEHVETFPADRIIGAFLMVLPRLDRGESQTAVCEILDNVGFDRIGNMLRRRMRNNRGSSRERLFINHVLAAFEVYPKLLQNNEIGAWFDALPSSRLWSPTFTVSYVAGVSHRPDAHMMRVIANFKQELNLLTRLLDEHEVDWIHETQGLKLDPVLIQARARLLINESDHWSPASKQSTRDYARDWTRFTASL